MHLSRRLLLSSRAGPNSSELHAIAARSEAPIRSLCGINCLAMATQEQRQTLPPHLSFNVNESTFILSRIFRRLGSATSCPFRCVLLTTMTKHGRGEVSSLVGRVNATALFPPWTDPLTEFSGSRLQPIKQMALDSRASRAILVVLSIYPPAAT